MFDYLQQFNSLPKDLKDKVSSPEAMSILSEIESRYRVDLAMVVMKVMIKTLTFKELPLIFASEFGLAPDQAEKMTDELKTKIFAPVADYVGISSELKTLDLYKDIGLFIKEAGLLIPSEFLVERLKKILATYLRGVRSRIDTRASLSKDIPTGGLNLSAIEVDRVLKVCDGHKYQYNANAEAEKTPAPATRLDKIISSSDGNTAAKVAMPASGEYDLKRALASGETKSLVAPEELLELKAASAPAKNKEPERTIPASEPKTTVKPIAPPAPLKTPIVDKVPPVAAVKPTPEKLVIKKPETNNLIKKLFADNSLASNKGAVRIANISEDANVAASVIKPAVTPTAPKPKIPTNTAAARQAVSKEETPKGRKPMQDVKSVPKIMGPLEELQFLDLTNFRRLGKTPEEITTKILNKIKLLEHDGYEKMIMGISAWRKSPVSRLYLRIVQEAVAANLPLKEAITARENRQEEGLSLAEIEAIMSLNSKLVF